VIDNPKGSEKSLIAAINAMNRIHIRRARLLGLDAPQKLDIRGLDRIGGDQQSAERLARERVLGGGAARRAGAHIRSAGRSPQADGSGSARHSHGWSG
jgi:hypothetical protein